MNKKKMAVSIMIAMMVTVIFAATATAIDVNGDCSDWPAGTLAKTDSANDPAGIHGYDLEALHLYYDSDTNTLFARLEVYGTPADLDGVGGTDENCATVGDCTGVGPEEHYTLRFNSTGKPDTVVRYKNNTVSNGAGAAAHGTSCIEFSLSDATSYIDPSKYCIFVIAGGMRDAPGEDTMEVCIDVPPPPPPPTSPPSRLPPSVPVLTPAGILALAAILCAAGVGRVARRR